jgi:hypothetical protein
MNRTPGISMPVRFHKILVPLSVLSVGIMALFSSCDGKYQLPNMESGEMIDVSGYIEEGWIPDSCNGFLSGIINPDPYQPDSSDNQTLGYIAEDWLEQRKHSFDVSAFKFPAAQTKYAYSYIIFTNPVDVYVTTFVANGDTVKLFVRYDVNSFWGPYDEQGWVICTNKS